MVYWYTSKGPPPPQRLLISLSLCCMYEGCEQKSASILEQSHKVLEIVSVDHLRRGFDDAEYIRLLHCYWS